MESSRNNSGSIRSINRREWLQGTAAIAIASASARASPAFAAVVPRVVFDVDIFRQPDLVRVFTGDARDVLQVALRTNSTWSAADVDVTYSLDAERGTIRLSAASTAVRRVHLRWHGKLGEDMLVLGDAWERSYADLAWMPVQAERPLPWYCLLHRRGDTLGLGVATGAKAFAFWQVDPAGVSLWLDVRNGGNGVRLGGRSVDLATVIVEAGAKTESAFEVTRSLCRKMSARSPMRTQRGGRPLNAIFGSNDWYYAYGKNTAEGILRDADLVREVSPPGPIQPFTVIDDGYDDRSRFPDIRKLASDIRSRDVVPGIWVRPTRAASGTKTSLLLPGSRYGRRQERTAGMAYDPTIPEARLAILKVVRDAVEWGYDLIKHDFTTYELLGQWGNEMGPSPSLDGWNFMDRSQTNAEIISSLYRDIRNVAGEGRIVLGCNTVGHLAAGIFDAQRTGDDVSGRDWERTRRMGVNTLAFRLPQNGIFFANDADCVPLTKDIPWKLTEQWLRAVANSGTVLLISPEPGAVGPEQKRALREAFAVCAAGQAHAEPTDWLTTRTPAEWSAGAKRETYKWMAEEGASPFSG